MKILFLDWDSFGNEDMVWNLKRLGHTVHMYPFSKDSLLRKNKSVQEPMIEHIRKNGYDFVFSFNYFPIVSDVCMETQTLYLSWIYDCPTAVLYSITLNNPCNYIFVFDSHTCEELRSCGFTTVYYLPLASNPLRFDKMIPSTKQFQEYSADISFIGSTYLEKKHNFFEKLDALPDFFKGYIDGVLSVQQKLYGKFILQDIITPDIKNALQSVCAYEEYEDGYESSEWIYANYFLAHQVTAIERFDILKLLSEDHQVVWYTHENTPNLPKVDNRGPKEYYMEMPYIFKCSKINLNISLKSIQTGIPLRIFDIIGCGGFTLTNYQKDLFDCFEPGKDLIFYEDYDDLKDKCNYYLSHDSERIAIAGHGYETLKNNHTFEHRIQKMLEIIK